MLQVKNLTKVYKSRRSSPTTALNGINIKFPDKGLVFILGKSGSGKSTLLNVLGGLDRFDDGEIIIDNTSSRDFSQSDFDAYRNTCLGFVFQDFNIIDTFSVSKNIELALQLQKQEPSKTQISEILEKVDLKGFENRKPNELSGGQKQRVAIARALVKNPKIILADEPTGALDSNTGKQVFDMLKRLSEEKLIVVVSHDREFASIYADRIIELRDGCIVSDITKVNAKAEKQSGVCPIDKTATLVPHGFKFSGNDSAPLNDMLSEFKTDTYLVAYSEEEFAKLYPERMETAKEKSVTFSGNFIQTDESKIVIKQEELTLIKSRLPFFDAFKIALSNFGSKKLRLVFTLFLSIMSLVFFGVATMMSSYDRAKIYAKTFYTEDAYVIGIENERKVSTSSGSYTVLLPFSESDVAAVSEAVDGSYLKVYALDMSDDGSAKMDAGYFDVSDSTVFRPYSFNGLIEATEGQVQLAYGSFPKAYDEICVSDLYAEYYIKLGMRTTTGNDDVSKLYIDNYEQLLQRSITLGKKEFKIVGVFKTNYYVYKQAFGEMTLAEINESPILSKMKTYYDDDFSLVMSKFVVKDGYSTRVMNDYTRYNAELVIDFSGLNANYYPTGLPIVLDDKYGLDKGEVMISANWYNYCVYGVESTKTYEQLSQEFLSDRQMYFYTSPVVYDMNAPKTYEAKLNVVGLYNDLDSWTDQCIYVSESDFKDIVGALYSPKMVLISALHSGETLYSLITELQTEGYKLTSRMGEELNNVDYLMNSFTEICFLVSFGLAIFVTLLLFNFISVSIVGKKKEIGILRAIGARGVDVMQIFVYESLLIGVVILLFSVPIVAVAASYANSLLSVGLAASIVSFKAKQAFLMAALTLVIIFIASIIPVVNISRKKPIEAIREN